MPLTLAIAALASIGMVAAATAGAVAHTQKGGPAKFDHIYVIVLENHQQNTIDTNMPYTKSLADAYGVATNYYGVTHPSMPNYLAMIAGDTYGINNDDDTSVVNLDRRNLVDQLEAHGISWGAYFQDLPANKVDSYNPSSSVKLYAKKHNPFLLFNDIKYDAARMANIKDYSALSTDLNSPGAPQFSFIVPNQCNDLHGGVYSTVAGHPETPCPYNSAPDDSADQVLKANADAFVQNTVQTIMGSSAWTARSAIVIVSDEGDYNGDSTTAGWESTAGCCDSPFIQAGDSSISAAWPGGTYGGGLVPAIVVTGHGPRHIVDNTPYNHYSLLRTIEDNWHLGHIGYSGDTQNGVVPMWKAFGRGGNPN